MSSDDDLPEDSKLTIFPIGLTKVPEDMSEPPKNPPLGPHLIEEPITIV